MKKRYRSSSCIALAALLGLAVPLTASDRSTDPPSELSAQEESAAEIEDDATAQESVDEAKQATLKIDCDLDCTVTVGLDLPRPVTAGETLTIKTEPGLVRVKAALTELPEARTFEDVDLEPGGRHRVRLKMAKALADLRKVQARDRTFRDPRTRLMWPRTDNGSDLVWDAARDYCDELEHGGWEDWRLPTLQELETLEAMWSLRPYKVLDPIQLTACCSWSADPVDDENAWNFNFQFRRAFKGHLDYSLSLRALCVRDGSDEIPEDTRKNRRLAKRQAKEKKREKLRRQAEEAAAEKSGEAAAEGDPEAAKEDVVEEPPEPPRASRAV